MDELAKMRRAKKRVLEIPFIYVEISIEKEKPDVFLVREKELREWMWAMHHIPISLAQQLLPCMKAVTLRLREINWSMSDWSKGTQW